MSNWIIREAIPQDIPAILQLIKDLAVFSGEPESIVITTSEILHRDCFGEEPWFFSLVAEQQIQDSSRGEEPVQPSKEIVGHALYHHAYSTWSGRMLYVEDIFVAEKARKTGIGKAFIAEIAKIAIEKKCDKVKWSVLDWNQETIDFYKNLGAELDDRWVVVYLLNGAMHRLASIKQ